MADYSSFPWNLWTKEEIARMMIDSKNVGDGDFVRACLGELARRRTQAPPDASPKQSENHKVHRLTPVS